MKPITGICPAAEGYTVCTKLVSVNETKNVTQLELVKIEKCCPGYEPNHGKCIPICKSGCENAVCVDPVYETCQCNDGFVPDSNK